MTVGVLRLRVAVGQVDVAVRRDAVAVLADGVNVPRDALQVFVAGTLAVRDGDDVGDAVLPNVALRVPVPVGVDVGAVVALGDSVSVPSIPRRTSPTSLSVTTRSVPAMTTASGNWILFAVRCPEKAAGVGTLGSATASCRSVRWIHEKLHTPSLRPAK